MPVTGYHAHVYFDETTAARAQALCEKASGLFDVKMGRVHRKLVGPHPRWSCQLAFAPELFGDIIPWLNLHRDGLVVFVHPETGDDYTDHSAYAMWLGPSQQLDLSLFDKPA